MAGKDPENPGGQAAAAATAGNAHGFLSSALVSLFFVAPGRKHTVLDDIEHGSVPSPFYYVMLGVSGLIAAFGLLANSPAVVIGAMLVSPLMTPILGVAVGLSRGQIRLIRHSLISEFGGVAIIIALCFLLGLMPFSLEVTPEMLARTRPTLLDLFVAALAGLAGCLSFIDERASPVLPGVAIATALTPPLATCGLSLAFGAYEGAWGAFLLFFANFLAILVVATAVFIAAGFVSREEIGSTRELLRRFSVAGASLLAVIVLLTYYLIGTIEHWRTRSTIIDVIQAKLENEPGTFLEGIQFDHVRGTNVLDILAVVRTPRVLSPQKVSAIEEAVNDALDEQVNLFFRCSITWDVTASGSTNLLARQNLDGTFAHTNLSDDLKTVLLAEQVVREWIGLAPNTKLEDLQLVTVPSGPVIVATISTNLPVSALAVERVEATIRERLDSTDVRLLIRSFESMDMTSKGRVLFGEAHFGVETPDEKTKRLMLENQIREEISRLRNIIPVYVDAVRRDDGWAVRANVVGPSVPTPAQVAAIERKVSGATGEPVAATVWASTDVIITRKRYDSVDAAVRELDERVLPQAEQKIRERLKMKTVPEAR